MLVETWLKTSAVEDCELQHLPLKEASWQDSVWRRSTASNLGFQAEGEMAVSPGFSPTQKEPRRSFVLIRLWVPIEVYLYMRVK